MENLGAVSGTPAAAGAGGTGDAGAGATGGSGGGVATEIDPNAGGDGGAGEGGTGGDGSGSAEGEGEGAGDGAGDEGAAAGEGEGEGEGKSEESDGSEFETDGRKIDDATKKALAALKKVDPEAAKRTAEAYFKHQAYQKVFPTVHEARGAKATIDALGGQEGIQNLQTKVGDYEKEIDQFAQGDPQLLTSLWEADPKGVELSTTAAFELIAKNDGDMFDRVLAGPMVTRLEKAGLYNALGKMAEFIKAGDGDGAYKLLQDMSKFFDNAKSMSQKQLELKERVDPERQKFDQERKEFEQQKTQEYEGRITANANTLNNKAMASVVEPFFKELNMPREGRREFVQNLQNKVWAAMKEDKVFQTQARTIQKKGDAVETAEFVAEKFAELLPGIFRTYRNALYPNYAKLKTTKPAAGGAAKGANGGAAAGTKAVTLGPGGRPKHSDVDWTKTSTIDWITGKAWLVNGKRVEFDKNAPPNKM